MHLVFKITEVNEVKGGFYKVKARMDYSRVFPHLSLNILKNIRGTFIYLDKTN